MLITLTTSQGRSSLLAMISLVAFLLVLSTTAHGAEWIGIWDVDEAYTGSVDGVDDVFSGGQHGLGCACCCEPLWTFRAGAIGLHRRAGNQVLIINRDTSTEQINARQIGRDSEPGFEGLIRRRTNFHCLELEARFFSVGAGTVRQKVNFTSSNVNFGDPLFIFNIGVGASQPTVTFSSELHSFEFNVRRRSGSHPWWTWMAGYRYLEMDED